MQLYAKDTGVVYWVDTYRRSKYSREWTEIEFGEEFKQTHKESLDGNGVAIAATESEIYELVDILTNEALKANTDPEYKGEIFCGSIAGKPVVSRVHFVRIAYVGKNRARGKDVPVKYVLAEYWCDYDNGLASGNAGTPTVEIYDSFESARIALEAKVEHERSEGLIADWHDIDGYMEEINENSFECWIDGEWMEKHLVLLIQPCRVNE